MPGQFQLPQGRGFAALRHRAARSGKLYFNNVESVLAWPERAGQAMARQRGGANLPTVAVRLARLQRFTQAMAVASFMLETRAGRDAIAKDVLNTVEKSRDRKKFDGLLATVVAYLHNTGSADAGRGLQLWKNTANTAQGIDTPVFDSKANRLTALPNTAFDPANGIFGRGLEAQNLFDVPGSEVSESDSCGLVFEGLSMLAGEINFGAGLAVAVAGHAICGGGETDPEGRGGAEGNTGSPEEAHDYAPEKDTTETETKSSGDGKGDDDKPPPDDKGGWPNPEEGYPAPDDGGGNPWSNVGVSAIPSRASLSALMVPAAGGGYDVSKAVAAIHSDTNAINPNVGLINTLLQAGASRISAQTHLASFARQFNLPIANTATLPPVAAKIGERTQ